MCGVFCKNFLKKLYKVRFFLKSSQRIKYFIKFFVKLPVPCIHSVFITFSLFW